ncbi:MAG TPA: hypothetical protein VH206_07870 [Xanthobacteraceae bacterium]|jgi:hypothetical protein|nr:hypothetical protein [Xanthobacteraceae bacterium]
MKGSHGCMTGLAWRLVWSVTLTLAILGGSVRSGMAQAPAVCGDFQKLSEDAGKKAQAVQAGMKAKVERKEVCKLMTVFVAAETKVVKFLQDNQTWCGVPAQVVANSKTAHEHSVKFQTAACNENAPERKAPTLSDAIQTPKVDSATNTKTGKGGAFDTMTGNPLGR